MYELIDIWGLLDDLDKPIGFIGNTNGETVGSVKPIEIGFNTVLRKISFFYFENFYLQNKKLSVWNKIRLKIAQKKETYY